jgi:hypothetical protein
MKALALRQVCILEVVLLLLFDDIFSLFHLLILALLTGLFLSTLLVTSHLTGLFGGSLLLKLCLGLGILGPTSHLVGLGGFLLLVFFKLFTGLPGLILLTLTHLLLVALKVVRLLHIIFMLSLSVLFSFELSAPLVVKLLLLEFFRRERSSLLLTCGPLFLGFFELISLLLGSHQVALSALALHQNFVTDAFLSRVWLRDIILCVMVVFATDRDFFFLVEALMVLRDSKIWANIVEVVHLLTLVVLK